MSGSRQAHQEPRETRDNIPTKFERASHPVRDAAERSTKALIAESGHVRELIEKVNAQFLLTDLKIGMTFLHIARSTLNPETARRNIVNARRALNMVTHRIALLRASREKMVEIEANLKLLKNELREFE